MTFGSEAMDKCPCFIIPNDTPFTDEKELRSQLVQLAIKIICDEL